MVIGRLLAGPLVEHRQNKCEMVSGAISLIDAVSIGDGSDLTTAATGGRATGGKLTEVSE
jgi:hypothetical protein